MRHRNAIAAAFAVLLAAGVRAEPAPGDDEKTPDDAVVAVADAAVVRAALDAFGKAVRVRSSLDRLEAVRALATCVHEKVVRRLLRFSRTEDDFDVLAATFDALARQKPFADLVGKGLARRLEEEARAAGERLAKGDAGFRVDPRTGDADTTSREGRARLQVTEQRGRMLASLVRAVAELGWTPPRAPPDLTPLLEDPTDDLVVAALGRIGAWSDWAALPALLDLHRLYPSEYSWETGAVVDLAGTDATAKAKWMVKFGHPGKRRARPAVVEALRTTLTALTGASFESPDALARYLGRADVVARLAKAERRR